ncbi:MAG: V-type ATP synthase subunit E [Anaerolineae bacterium]
MKSLESGKDKVKKICEVLKKETLEPAISEASAIVEKSHLEAETMIREAQAKIDKMYEEARIEIEREKATLLASIAQSCKQAKESLKQMIEEKLFNQELSDLIAKQMQDPKVLAELINAIVKALEKEGLDADFSVYVPAAVPARSVNMLLAQRILDKLKEKSVLLSSIGGGIEVKLHHNHITIDLSDTALKDLMASYMHKDFREILFNQLI